MAKVNVPLIATALADPTRYRALTLICACDMISSQALCEKLDVAPATVSHHLRQLRLASLIESVHEGRWRRHRVKRETLDAYVAALSKI